MGKARLYAKAIGLYVGAKVGELVIRLQDSFLSNEAKIYNNLTKENYEPVQQNPSKIHFSKLLDFLMREKKDDGLASKL